MRAYLELIRIDLMLALRDKGVIFFTYLFPLIFFFGAAELMGANQGGTITYVVSMVLMIGILGNGLFGAGMRTVSDREQGILRRFRVAPITPAPLLVAATVTGWLLYMPAVLLVLALAHFVYRMPTPEHLGGLLILLTLGIFAFRSLGLILASVANSMQEINILVQLLYTPMLFLSGALFPITLLPLWVQIFSQYLPATYLVNAFQGSLLRNEPLSANLAAAGALVLTVVLGLFISTRIFRWEKGEKVPLSSKAWVLAVLTPFIALGTYQAFSHDQIQRAKVLYRNLQRAETLLIRGARIFVGDGEVIESGSVLVRNGRIEHVYTAAPPAADDLSAILVEASGKTLLPGLIDTHVHLSSPGGLLPADEEYEPEKAMERALAAYLYSGVTVVRTVGDPLSTALKLREEVARGERLGAELFVSTPMFTTKGGHGTEYFEGLPERVRRLAMAEWVRLPTSPDEARRQVAELDNLGVDGIKAILESGWSGHLFERLDAGVFSAIADEAARRGLSLSVHTGDSRDVADALAAGAVSIEHGSLHEVLEADLLQRVAGKGTCYAPTLSVVEALRQTARRDLSLLDRVLVQQAVPQSLLEATRSGTDKWAKIDADQADGWESIAVSNLLTAANQGVRLVAGTDSGNFLLPHGPAIHREMQLWVAAGLSPTRALQAATYNAARLLGIEQRAGRIAEGLEATFLLVDGNPLVDIANSERISMVIFKGERINRSRLFDQ